MKAEIVRADQIKVGDRLRHRGCTINVCESYPLVMEDTGRKKQAIRYRGSGNGFTTWRTDPEAEVARILPEPAEEIADVAVLRLALEDMHQMYGACASRYDFEEEFNDDVEHYIDAARAELTEGGGDEG